MSGHSSLKIAISCGDLYSASSTWFLGPSDSAFQTASRSVQPFLHSPRKKVPILYNGRPFRQKLPLPRRNQEPI